MRIVESQPSVVPSELVVGSATDRMMPEQPLASGKAGHGKGYVPALPKEPLQQSGQGQPGSSLGVRDPESGHQKVAGAGLSDKPSRLSMTRQKQCDNARDTMRTK